MDLTYLFFGLVSDTQLGQRILYALLETNSSKKKHQLSSILIRNES